MGNILSRYIDGEFPNENQSSISLDFHLVASDKTPKFIRTKIDESQGFDGNIVSKKNIDRIK